MNSDMPFVDVVSVLWNSARFMPALFEGLVDTDYPLDSWCMHFVDNNPGDGSLDEVKRLMNVHVGFLPQIRIHSPTTNTGFSGGNNLVMKIALERGTGYVFMLNHDARFEKSALREAIAVAESDPLIGSVQSLLVLQKNPQEINSRGNAIHYLGFGYCLGYHEKRSDMRQDIVDIGYASGAAALYPVEILRRVWLLDETLWLYHEDLDLGWRIRLAGYRNVLAPKSVVQHSYEFSRSISKWYWMERNRVLVVLKNFKMRTIVILLPQLIFIDIALFFFALKGGWWREKVKAWMHFFHLSTWKYIIRGRAEIARQRIVSDKDILRFCTPIIAYQEMESVFVSRIVNPIWVTLYRILRYIVIW